ncbi:MAG: hypothetical protein IIB57_06850 [Planctomycetes bacterium]|nr:hypothetical protein [Planctomycetota bacterium]
MLDIRRFAGSPDNRDDIEPAWKVTGSMGRKKVLCRTFQSGPLGRPDRFLRVSLGIVGTRFHLHEDDGVAVRCDQIDLAQGTTVIAVDDTVTAAT